MTDPAVRFELLKKDVATQARRGRLTTLHGVVETPVFMPVGTLGLVKSLDPRDLDDLGARIVLANAYHLFLRPGADVVATLGGLHRFSGQNRAILTDSGGFQVYSLAGLRKVSDEAVEFRSHIDGSAHVLSPERLVETQELLGPDIAMVLDECPPADASREVVEQAIKRTTLWAQRAVAARKRHDVSWFGIVQGALFEDLRRRHASEITSLPFAGYAIGGVSVGEAPEEIERIVRFTAPLLPQDKPRYLMGVGTPEDLVRGVSAGVDMFDCVMPTRNARNGQLFTSTGKHNIKIADNKQKDVPLDAACPCYTCKTFTRGFLRHLFIAKELSFFRLATIHNLTFYLRLMAGMRADLEADRFELSMWLKRARGEEAF